MAFRGQHGGERAHAGAGDPQEIKPHASAF
jgi:hypothetical protein